MWYSVWIHFRWGVAAVNIVSNRSKPLWPNISYIFILGDFSVHGFFLDCVNNDDPVKE